MFAAPELHYVEGLGYLAREEIPPGSPVNRVSGTRLRQLLAEGEEIPPWLAPPEVAAVLRQAVRPQ